MLNSKKRQQGATLLEAMLVIAIGASLVFMSIQVYQRYKHDADAYQVKANVDAIFQAMTGFYRANCNGFYSNGNLDSVPIVWGELNPDNSTAPPDNFSVSVKTKLFDNGYLEKLFALNPIIDASGPDNGYVAQFNKSTIKKSICVDGTNSIGPKVNCNTSNDDMGTIVIWQAQVAVKLKNPATAKQYLGMLGGDCLSTYAGGIVTPCTGTASGAADYVVWTRLPTSVANSNARSSYWPTLPVVNQFTQMYTTYPATTLTSGATNNDQQYLCN